MHSITDVEDHTAMRHLTSITRVVYINATKHNAKNARCK